MSADRVRFLVVRKRDTDPPEVYPFEARSYAEEFYELAALQWSETYLCQVIKPHQIENATKLADAEMRRKKVPNVHYIDP